MSLDKYFSIIGYSGHAYVVLDAALLSGKVCNGYCENEFKSFNPYYIEYLGNESELSTINSLRNSSAVIAIGNNTTRSNIYFTLASKKINFISVFHPLSVIANTASIKEATVVFAGAVINSLAKIGKGVICNTSCVIEHECIIGNFSHIAPGAVLAGNVTIGSNSFIGANAVIKEGIKIGNNAVIGAGAVIVKDIAHNTIVYGNPGKIIKAN